MPVCCSNADSSCTWVELSLSLISSRPLLPFFSYGHVQMPTRLVIQLPGGPVQVTIYFLFLWPRVSGQPKPQLIPLDIYTPDAQCAYRVKLGHTSNRPHDQQGANLRRLPTRPPFNDVNVYFLVTVLLHKRAQRKMWWPTLSAISSPTTIRKAVVNASCVIVC